MEKKVYNRYLVEINGKQIRVNALNFAHALKILSADINSDTEGSTNIKVTKETNNK